MKPLCLSFALLLFGGQLLAADDAAPIILNSQGMSGGTVYLPESKFNRAFQWQVSSEKWRQTPSWTPGAGPVPLDAHAAAVAALRWIKAQPWAGSFERLYGIELNNHPKYSGSTSPTDIHWCYIVQFKVKEGPEKHQIPHEAVVLLDGTVVEPTAPLSSAPTRIEP